MSDINELGISTSDSFSFIVNPENVNRFLLAGNCYCSIENLKTGNRFSYRIKKSPKIKNMYFVNVDSGVGSIYCGYFYKDANLYDYRKGAKGNVDADDIRIKALLYTLENSKKLPNFVIVEHHGYCAQCGVDLTEVEEYKYGLCNMCKPII